MGVDLSLMPLMAKDFWASSEVYRLHRRRKLWEAFEALKEIPVPKKVSCYAGDHYTDIDTNPYGTRLTYLHAGKLMELSEHEAVQDNWRNRGIWKLLSEMPEDLAIVLYWH